MQPIIRVSDSVFQRAAAENPNDFFDRLYGKDAPAPSASPTGKGRPDSGAWEEIPRETAIWQNHQYHVTPQDHRTLHDWVGPNGERVMYHPERFNPDIGLTPGAQYHVTHEMPDGSVKKHVIHPSLMTPNKWWHRSTHYADPEAMRNDDTGGIIEEYSDMLFGEDGGRNHVGDILHNIGRLNNGETVQDVYPEHYYQGES